MVDLAQADTAVKINLTNPQAGDRIVSAVVRNYGIWATQQVGLPAASPTSVVSQWWNIGVDSYLGNIYDFERIGFSGGPKSYNALFPAIGVNYYSDVVVGFSEVSSRQYVSAAYIYKDHTQQAQNSAYTYETGYGPYLNTSERLGDYNRATVDPQDDFLLWATVEFAGSLLSSSPLQYGWRIGDAFIWPTASPQFIGSSQAVSDCSGSAPVCTVTLIAPPGAKRGDVFLVSLADGLGGTVPTAPAGWNLVYIQNIANILSNHSWIYPSDDCSWAVSSVVGYVYGSQPDDDGT